MKTSLAITVRSVFGSYKGFTSSFKRQDASVTFIASVNWGRILRTRTVGLDGVAQSTKRPQCHMPVTGYARKGSAARHRRPFHSVFCL